MLTPEEQDNICTPLFVKAGKGLLRDSTKRCQRVIQVGERTYRYNWRKLYLMTEDELTDMVNKLLK